MKFILVLFANKDLCNPSIIGFTGFKSDAEQQAEKHLKEHPEDAIHIYEWAVGYEAITRINIDRQWYCPQLPVDPPKSPLMPEVPECTPDEVLPLTQQQMQEDT